MSKVITDFRDFLRVERLTEAQSDAVTDRSREVQAIAGAGSGKSRTLSYRIARLLHEKVEPERIVAFTFTVKAAESLKQRVAAALSSSDQNPLVIGRMFIGTIDAFTKNTLGAIDARYRQYDQLDPPRMVLYIMSRYAMLGVKEFRAGRPYFKTVEGIAAAWDQVQNENIPIEHVKREEPVLGKILEDLRYALDRDGYVDFASTCRKVASAYEDEVVVPTGRLPVIEHLLVDEYQDINPLQERLVRAIRTNGASIFVVGDDDQSIFGFRGADVHNILEFRNRYPHAGRHELTENFRSTPAIVQAASNFVATQLGANRLPKNLRAVYDKQPQDLGVLIFDTAPEEARWVAHRIKQLLSTTYEEEKGGDRGLTPGDFAILMKSTRRGDYAEEAKHRTFTDALQAEGIPFVVESTGDLFDRPWGSMIRDVIRLLATGVVNRDMGSGFFEERIVPLFPGANKRAFLNVLTEWGRLIHAPIRVGGPRRRVYPQQLLQELLASMRFADTKLNPQAMHDLGTVSRILQDVESVFPSIDGAERFASIAHFLAQTADGAYEPTEESPVREDAVFVSTIHKSKGLEFPVVFIVDCRATSYPGRRGGYDGFLPAALIAPAVARGSYANTHDGAARVFYTALTRAERFLYVTAARDHEGLVRPAALSAYACSVRDSGAVVDASKLSTPGLTLTPKRRMDEDILPTTFTDIRAYLRCPHDFQMRKVYGFSPPIGEMFGFGQSVHTTIGKIHEAFPDSTPTGADAELIAQQTFHLKHVMPSKSNDRPGPYENALAATKQIVRKYVEDNAADFAGKKRVEARFEIPVAGAVITGAIDLLVRHGVDGQVVEAEVVDFKAIKGAEQPGKDPLENDNLRWDELTLQVQLYAHAANEILGENARTGSVHLLKTNDRVSVPVDDRAVSDALGMVGWVVDRIVNSDFPMRPHPKKCHSCDFERLCRKQQEEFKTTARPAPLHLPNGREMPGAFDGDGD